MFHKVAAVINRVQIKIKKGDYGHKRRDNLKFIEEERKHVLGRIFDIATTEKSPNLKASELVSTELIFCLLDISRSILQRHLCKRQLFLQKFNC